MVPARRESRSRDGDRRGGWPQVLGWLAWGLVLLAAFDAAALVAWERCLPGGWCPEPAALEAYQPRGAPIVLDREGREVADLHPLQQRVIPMDSVPAHLPQALIAVEDHRFHRHHGIDWHRVAPAALRGQGASTITMQLARTLFPDLLPRHERTLRRKLQEMRIAGDIERKFAKEEILELYLNHVYFGGGRYGMEEASHHFFGHTAAELDLEHSALLAGMARAPARFDPREHPERARDRRNLVLRLMQDQGRISPAEAEAAREQPLGVLDQAPPRREEPEAPWFVEAVRRWVEDRFGDELLRSAARIHTTLDPRAQAVAEEELVRQLERIEAGALGIFAANPGRAEGEEGDNDSGSDQLEGAVVILDPVEGDLLALVGGRDHATSPFDRATRAQRQVGSAFKPFVYAAALSAGFLQSQPIADIPFEIQVREDEPPWTPGNYDGRFRGSVNMREALVHSVNVPAARMGMAVGLDAVVAQARAAGIRSPIPETPAAALGTASLSPLEMAEGFAAFAGLGRRPALRIVTRIEAEDGEVLYESEPRRDDAFDPRVAYIITDMLTDVVNRGTGAEVRSAGYQGIAAGKTGTTQEAQDAWFVGYTSDLVSSVWIGFDQPREIVPGGTGGTLAAPVWGRMMTRLYEDRDEPEPWPMPDGIVETGVDPESGMYVEEGCEPAGGNAIRVLFLEEHQPQATCPVDRGWLDRLRILIGGEPDDGPGTPEIPGARAFDLDSPVHEILGASRVPVRGGG